MAGERETFPSERSLADAREEALTARLRGPCPGRIQRWDAATQTADVVPLIRQPVAQPDGTYTMVEDPVVPSVAVLVLREITKKR